MFKQKFSAVILAVVLVLTCFPFGVFAADTITVSITVIGDNLHRNSAHSKYQIWIEKTSYTMPAGSSAMDLLRTALNAAGMKYSATFDYVRSIKAPDVLGSFTLGESANGGWSGWTFTVNDPGPSDPKDYHPDRGADSYILNDGDNIIVHYLDDWMEEAEPGGKYFKRWYDAEPLPSGKASTGGISGGGSGGGGGGWLGGLASIFFPQETGPKIYIASDLKKMDDGTAYRLSVAKNSVISSGELKNIPQGIPLYADTISSSKVSFRIAVTSPAALTGDISFAVGYEPDTGSIGKLFRSYFSNKIEVLAFEQNSPWGQTVEVMAALDMLSGFKKDSVALYLYDGDKNSYDSIPYTLDANGYIRFKTDNANPVIFSDGEFIPKV